MTSKACRAFKCSFCCLSPKDKHCKWAQRCKCDCSATVECYLMFCVNASVPFRQTSSYSVTVTFRSANVWGRVSSHDGLIMADRDSLYQPWGCAWSRGIHLLHTTSHFTQLHTSLLQGMLMLVPPTLLVKFFISLRHTHLKQCSQRPLVVSKWLWSLACYPLATTQICYVSVCLCKR